MTVDESWWKYLWGYMHLWCSFLFIFISTQLLHMENLQLCQPLCFSLQNLAAQNCWSWWENLQSINACYLKRPSGGRWYAPKKCITPGVTARGHSICFALLSAVLDAIASPSTYPSQWVVCNVFRFWSHRIYRVCKIVKQVTM